MNRTVVTALTNASVTLGRRLKDRDQQTIRQHLDKLALNAANRRTVVQLCLPPCIVGLDIPQKCGGMDYEV
jgi:hypothetical protein